MFSFCIDWLCPLYFKELFDIKFFQCFIIESYVAIVLIFESRQDIEIFKQFAISSSCKKTWYLNILFANSKLSCNFAKLRILGKISIPGTINVQSTHCILKLRCVRIQTFLFFRKNNSYYIIKYVNLHVMIFMTVMKGNNFRLWISNFFSLTVLKCLWDENSFHSNSVLCCLMGKGKI